jgi:hypothetical protein
MATTTTNFGWDIPQSTDLVKDGATAIAALGQDIDTALVDLKGGTTGQVLAKASGTDLDFSWVAQDDSNAIQNAIVDAKGDLIGATAADTPARLAVGTDGQVLTADSAAATGLAWATPASGGWTLISTSTPSSATAIDFNSISSDYKQLCVTWAGLYASANNTTLLYRLNNDSGANYKYREIDFTNSTVSGYFGAETNMPCFVRTTSTSSTDTAAGYVMIYNANSTTLHKYMESVTSYRRADTSVNVIRRGSWHYASTSAISSVNFYRGETTGTINAISGGFIQLWGLK